MCLIYYIKKCAILALKIGMYEIYTNCKKHSITLEIKSSIRTLLIRHKVGDDNRKKYEKNPLWSESILITLSLLYERFRY